MRGSRPPTAPRLTSAFGQRSIVTPPTSTLNGGFVVEHDTTTYNAGLAQAFRWTGGNVQFSFNNNKQVTNNRNVNFNPSFQNSFSLVATQPLLRGLFIDNNRQQLRVTAINRDISEIQLRGTIATTLATVRNSYWELVYAIEAVEVARGSLTLAEKLVEDNRARVEVGTMAPLDVVQAEAEVATRRQALAQAEATWRTTELTLKRLIVNGTDDPLWRASLTPTDRPTFAPEPLDVESAVRRALDSAHRPGAGAPDDRGQRRDAALHAQPDAAGARPDRELRRAGAGRHAVHPPGLRA